MRNAGPALVLVVFAVITANAQAATGGSITAKVAPDWNSGTATFSATVDTDVCTGQPWNPPVIGAPIPASCNWNAAAWTRPAALGICPSDPFATQPSGTWRLTWNGDGAKLTTTGTIASSAPVPLSLFNGVSPVRVCLYMIRSGVPYVGNGGFVFTVLATVIAEVEAPAAAPPPAPVSSPQPVAPTVAVTLTSARRLAASALLARFGSSWRRGKARRLKCSTLAVGVVECRASWRKGKRTTRRRVVVTVAAGKLRTSIRR